MKVLISPFFYQYTPQKNILLINNNIKNSSNAYGVVNISIKYTKVHLNELYWNSITLGSRGVIKVDDEEYETYLQKAITKTLTSDNSVAIIFEKHDPDLTSS